MRKIMIGVAAVCVVIIVVGASIAQFRNDERKYCRVRFGRSDANDIVFARTPDSLLLFRSGDVQAKTEEYSFKDGRLPKGVTIPPIKLTSGTSYTITSVSEYIDEEPTYRHSLMLHVTIEGDASFKQYCDVELTSGTRDLKLAHFDGPLSVGPVTINWEVPAGTQFVIGGGPTDIRVNVATLDKTRGCWTVVASGDDKIPEGVHPTVTVEFPAESSAKPIVRTYPLDKFC